jgi:tRNA pseudouridine13 synthase
LIVLPAGFRCYNWQAQRKLPVPEIDRQLGMDAYVTTTPGVAGVIRKALADFVVEEVLLDGSKASIQGIKLEKAPFGATVARQRFLLCSMVKRNWDTFAAIKKVSMALGIDSSCIQFAGIKDAKAITSQHITLDGLTLEDASRVNLPDVELHPLGYFREPLSSFYLLGNNFTIKISDFASAEKCCEDQILLALKELEAAGGIPNFYGHQRFGTTRPITHIVGKAMVQGEIEEAAMLFLAKPSDYEHPASRLARVELLETRNFRRALEMFPLQLRYERLMLSHLVEYPGDFVGSFRRLPVKLRMLFVHAYQSILFNRFLSERLKLGYCLGRAEVGDFVVNVERSGLPMVRTGKIVEAAKLGEVNESVQAGKMRVALPIVGFSQRLSQGKAGELQREILDSEHIQLQNFRVEQLPEINGKGELRAVVSPVNNFVTKNAQPENNGSDLGLVWLEFMLFRGSYATVLLREIMKPKNPISAGF